MKKRGRSVIKDKILKSDLGKAAPAWSVGSLPNANSDAPPEKRVTCKHGFWPSCDECIINMWVSNGAADIEQGG